MLGGTSEGSRIMKETGIMFSTLMVQALPHKSQTRRTRGLEVINENPDAWVYKGRDGAYYVFEFIGMKNIDKPREIRVKCPYGRKGDGLWCKETWGLPHNGKAREEEKGDLVYKATNGDKDFNKYGYKWRSAMFMFRWMSRHLLELIEEPVPQRLWDITEEDAIAEGAPAGYIEASPTIFDKGAPNYKETPKDYRKGFARLWDSINGKKYPWSGNHWCWKLCFKEIKP
jgi:hypothetical protein